MASALSSLLHSSAARDRRATGALAKQLVGCTPRPALAWRHAPLPLPPPAGLRASSKLVSRGGALRRRPGVSGALHKLRKRTAAAAAHFQRRAAVTGPLLTSGQQKRMSAESPSTSMQHSLLLVRKRLQVFRRKLHFPPPFLCAPAVPGTITVFATRWWPSCAREGAAAAVTRWHTAVSWCAPPLRHLFLRAAARHVPCASAARGWRGSMVRRRRCCVGAVFLVCSFLGRETLGRERPPRTHSHVIFEPFTLPDVVRAVGSAAHDSCCSSCHHIDRRLDLGLAPLALACRRWPQHNHRALHGAAAARVRVCQSLGVKRHRCLRRGTVLNRSAAYFVAPPPGLCSAQAALRASGASTCSRCSSSSSDRGPCHDRHVPPCPPPLTAPLPKCW